MTSFTSPEIVAGVRFAFGRCRGPHNADLPLLLTERTVLRGLVIARLVRLPDVTDPRHMPVRDLWYESGIEQLFGAGWAVQNNCETLGDLAERTRAEVLAWPRVGPRGLARIERGLARFGLTLQDGDPALVEQECPAAPPAPRRRRAAGGGGDNVIRGVFG